MSVEEIVASTEAEGRRLDRFLCEQKPALGRAAARRLIDAGLVRVNGARAVAGQRLRNGDRVVLREARSSTAAVADAAATLHIAYEDEFLVVADKPAGMPAHPLRPDETGTLASALLARYPEMAAVGYTPREPGLLHRLDTDTSGLVLAARDVTTFAALRAQLRAGAIDKRYLALCSGHPATPATHDAFLSAKGARVSVRRDAFAAAQPIRTELLAAEAHGVWSLVSVRVPHARRHQVRAHLAWLGHAIAADARYAGAPLADLTRHFLHASELHFAHPRRSTVLSVRSPLPEELVAALQRCGG